MYEVNLIHWSYEGSMVDIVLPQKNVMWFNVELWIELDLTVDHCEGSIVDIECVWKMCNGL